MKDVFGREIVVGDTVAYALHKNGLSFYKVSKLGKGNFSGVKYWFNKTKPDGFVLSDRAVGLIADPAKIMFVHLDTLPIYQNTPM